MSRKSRGGRTPLESLESRRLMAAHIVGNSTVYQTIQSAVNAAAPRAVVTVDPGTYAEMVTINKSVTLRGAQAGVDARGNQRQGAAESVTVGYDTGTGISSSFYIAADDVTLDGFTVQGNTSGTRYGAGIVIAPQISGTQILNNIVQNNVSGLFLSNYNGSKQAIIQHNLFRANNNAGGNGGRAIYTDGGISGGNLTNVLIDANAFFDNRGGSGTTQLEAAIAIEAATAGKQSNITITNNVMDGNGKATLFFNTTGILIQNNVITNTLDKYSGTLRFEGNNHDVRILNNTVYDNTGPAVAVDSKGVAGDNYNFVLNYNNFYNNSLGYGSKISVTFDGSVYVGSPDVRYNWWGSSTGPGGDGPGSGDKVYGIGHVVPGGQWYVQTSGSELFSPWSTAPNGSLRSAYFGLPAGTDANVQFEDFDHGGESNGYHDASAGNSGGRYRTREAVDIETTSDSGGGYDVANVVAGEWLTYAIDAAQGGVFNLDLRVATSQSTGGTFHLEVDGQNVTGPITVPSTGGAQTWKTMTTTGLSIAAGPHVLRFVFDSNGSNGSVGSFNYFRLTNTAPSAIPAAPSGLLATAVSATTVNLTWADNATSESGYAVERKAGAAGAWSVIANLSINSVSYADTSAAAATTYGYRVRATGGAGDSAYSNEALVTTPAASSVTYLSDLPWLSATNGWGPAERDMSVGGSLTGDGDTLALNGVTYAKGLGVNATSDIVYNLAGNYGSFLADVGVDDHQIVNGTVNFQVFADGVIVFDSGVMTATSATRNVNVNVTGVQQLRLHVGDAGDGPEYDWADWAGARLAFGTVIQPPPPQQQAVPASPSGLVATAASISQINLTWSDNSSDETGFVIERSTNGSSGWTAISSPGANVNSYRDATGLSAGTAYYYRVRAVNAVGASTDSAVASATTLAAPAPGLPSGWSQTDIGATGAAGTGSYLNGTYTLSGAGAGLSGAADAFHFAYRSLSGDGTIIARVTGGTGAAGITFRNSMSAAAKEVSLVGSAGSISFTRRSSSGGSTVSAPVASDVATPYWLKLVRRGSTLTAYRSADGALWTLVGTLSINLHNTVYVGVFVSSGATASLATATFDNVSVTKP